MKIKVIFTGGTIGSSVSDGWISPDTKNNGKLINRYLNTHNSSTEFITENPYTVLSENLTHKELTLLTETVENSLASDCDGIIIAHGTDSLQYSAVAVSLCFQNTDKPIVFVSSNYPLDNERANGYDNFNTAVEFIKTKQKGTFIAYKNDKDNFIIDAEKAVTHSEMCDFVYSLNQPFAKYKNGKFIKSYEISAKEKTNIGKVNFIENPNILTIQMSPFINSYSLENINAIILRPYHSGTINTASQNLKQICDTAKIKNIPVYLCNASKDFSYESKKVFNEYGIIPLYDTTYISAFMKILINLSTKN